MTQAATDTLNFLNAALACFERVQIARSFGQDFDAHQIKLDIIQLRLSRWGEAAGICTNEPTAALAIPQQDANELLQGVEHLFDYAKTQAEKLRPKDTSAPGFDPSKDMRPLMKTLRDKLRASLSRRCAQLTNAAHSIQWAFYKKEQFDQFVTDISGLIDQLEALFPREEATARLRELSKDECAQIKKPYLTALKDVVNKECDPWLNGALEAPPPESTPGGNNTTFNTKHQNGFQIGNNSAPITGAILGTGHTINR